MGMIPEDKKELLKNDFNQLVNPVKIVMFTQEVECDSCNSTRELVQELATLSNKLSVEVYDFVADADKAKEYGVNKIPALAIVGAKDYGVRIYGLPYGYEFPALLDAIINVSKGETDLSEKTKKILQDVKSPVHIQVFVSMTCPHCPVAIAVAHKLAIENDFIKADAVNANEFQDLAIKYNVIGVPKVVINDKIDFVGAVDEDLFAENILLATVSEPLKK
ncbi:MAG: protein disulfide oxidoreductase [Candidatus Bathyarchaeia archaeon]|jgi:glutaredoxin-like protein